MRRQTLSLIAFVLLAVPIAGGATDAGTLVVHEPIPMRPGDTVEIDNVRGWIDVRGTGGTAATIAAHVIEKGTGRAHVVVDRGAAKVTICTVYGTSDGASTCASRAQTSDSDTDGTNVAYTIGVPSGVAVVARNVDGNVTVRDARAAVDAISVDGSVTVASVGPITAKTVDGAITAEALASRGAPCKLATVDGAVSLRLARGSDAYVTARTLDGAIDGTGFSFAHRDGSIVGHSASGTIGRGIGTVSLATVNGSIRVTAE